jgi:hypothetical protein
LDVFVGLPSLMNDVWVLQLFSIYQKTTWRNFSNKLDLHEGIKPYIIGGKGYPCYHSQWYFINKQEFNTLF